MTSKWELDTPCLVLDRDRFEANVRLMQDSVRRHNKQLRPHAKTHKCSRIAQVQMSAGSIGICVAKVSEAEVLIGKGIRPVLITSPVVTPHKIRRLMDCPGVMVVVDHADNARALHDAASQRGLILDVLIDVDSGMGRTGVLHAQAADLARAIRALPSLRLRGIQCYAGHLQHIASYDERRQASTACLQRAAEVFRLLRRDHPECDIFTGTGTGTYDIDCSIPELTDLQTGSYAMMDAEYMNIGSSEDPKHYRTFQPALTLLTTVVSVNQDRFVTVDAGLKALYHHGGTPTVIHPAGEFQYGWFGDEHGKIMLPPSAVKPKLGTVLELIVSHCDPTVNLFDALHITQQDKVIDSWPIDMRGKSQ